MSLRVLLRQLALVLLVTGCAKESTVEPLPLEEFSVHEAIPVRSVPIPATNGMALLCKRAIDDPVLAYALLFDANGALNGRIDFNGLPNTVENIAFEPESWFITDLVPAPDGTFLLIGLGRQVDLADRLHLLVYRVNAAGYSISAPVRRYVTDQCTLVRAEDMDQLYRTAARAALRTTEHLVATVRYDRQEGPIVNGYHRSFQIGLATGAGSYGTPAVEFNDPGHALHHVLADDQGGSYLLMDTTNAQGPGTHLLVKHIAWSSQSLGMVEEGILELRDAEPNAAFVQGGDLVLAGAYQVEADVRRPFFCRAPSVTGMNAGITFPDLGSLGRSALIGALTPTDNGFIASGQVYEQSVISLRAMRDDRFCDLVSAQLGPAGVQQESWVIIPGKGLRALGAWGADGRSVAGAFHPFLNTDYIHAFVLSTSTP